MLVVSKNYYQTQFNWGYFTNSLDAESNIHPPKSLEAPIPKQLKLGT